MEIDEEDLKNFVNFGALETYLNSLFKEQEEKYMKEIKELQEEIERLKL